MLRDSWEGRQQGLFLFSWEGPDPRNTVKHIWWGVSHNDFFGKAKRSRNKNNLTQLSVRVGGPSREPVWDHSSSVLRPSIPPHSKKSLTTLGQALPLKETKDTSRRSDEACLGHPTAQRWSLSCTALSSLYDPQAGPSSSPYDPRQGTGNTLSSHKGKPCRGHHPCPSSQLLGKDSPLSKEVTCAADPKIIRRKGKNKAHWRRCYLEFWKGRILLWLCCTSFRCVTPLHFLESLPNFYPIYFKGSIWGFWMVSCCVSATRPQSFSQNLAKIKALHRDNDEIATVFPKYLLCFCSQNNY